MSSPNSPQSRRTFLKRGGATVAGTAVAGGLPALAFGAQSALAADEASANPVVRENVFSNTSTHSTAYRVQNISSVVEGYARRSSVNLGEPIELSISGPNRWLDVDAPCETVEVELYRLGYYGGKGSRLVWKTPAPVSTWQKFDADGNPSNDGAETADKPYDANTGLRGRALNKTTVTVPGNAAPASGVYLAKLKGKWLDFPPGVPAVERTGESHIVFIVRDDARPRDVLAVLPTNTWQAYNYWGGRSTYTYNSRYGNSGSIVPATGTERAAKVSWDRPYNNWIGDYNWVLRTEFPAIWWMEQQGYDVSYTDDVAISFDATQLLPNKSKSVVILGHGEYWTKAERDGMEAARDAGTHIYNFGANTAYWRVRYEDADGKVATKAADARVMVVYKTIEGGGSDQPTVASQADPIEPTTTWRDPGKGTGITPGTTAALPAKYTGNARPERQLLGVQYIGDDDSTNRGLTVPADNGKGEFAGHRAWRNTGIPANKSTTLGTGLVGWEWDGIPTATQPFSGTAPKTKAGTTLQRLSETDPRQNQPSGAETAYVQDAGRLYGTRGANAQPPSGGNPFAHAITYTAPSGALVFSSGTIHWSWGLGPHHLDKNTDTYASEPVDSSLPQIRQATANLLLDGGIRPTTPVGLVLDGTTTPTTPGNPTPTTPGGTTPTTPIPTTPVPTTPKPTTPTTPTTPADKTPPAVSVEVTNSGLRLLGWTYIDDRDRKLGMKVSVSSAEKSGPVSLQATLRDAAGVLGPVVSGSVQPGKSVSLTVVVDSTAFKRISGATYRAATLTVVGTDSAGNAQTVNVSLRLRAS